jgi:hypothetical protein
MVASSETPDHPLQIHGRCVSCLHNASSFAGLREVVSAADPGYCYAHSTIAGGL